MENVRMAMLFVSFAAAGLALVLLQPTIKNRTKRLLSQGASTSLLAVGLFGGMIMIMSS
jgi:hypothetical protein